MHNGFGSRKIKVQCLFKDENKEESKIENHISCILSINAFAMIQLFKDELPLHLMNMRLRIIKHSNKDKKK